MTNYLKNIAILGASGNVGSPILRHLLATARFNITVITRSDSTATFPSDTSVTVKKGSYSDPTFLRSAFSGQDAVIITLGFTATDTQPVLIDAATKAGVKWILPNEYSADGANEAMVKEVPIFQPKAQIRTQINDLGVQYEGLKWISVVTNPWTEFSLTMGLFGINVKERKAVLYKDAGSFNTSTLEQAGRGVAALLSLPVTNADNSRASLQHYANNFVYISSFVTTQRELLDATLHATGTRKEDWSIEKSMIDGPGARIETARKKMAEGNWMAGGDLVYAYYMGEGQGGYYEEKAKEDREVLGLREEKIEDVIREAVKSITLSN